MNIPKRFLSYLTIFLATSLFTASYIFFFSKTDLIVSARLKAIDGLYVLRSKLKNSSTHLENIVIIGVDEVSYQKVAKASWGPEIYATALDYLQTLNPKVVGFDFTFIGRSSNALADKWFSESIQKSKNVILASFFDRSYQYQLPHELFRKGALGYGFIDKPYDRDGVFRRGKGFIYLVDEPYPAFPFSSEIAYAYLGVSPRNAVEIGSGPPLYQAPDPANPSVFLKIPVQVDKKNQWPVSYRYRLNSFHFIPFWKLIAHQVSRDEIDGKMVLIGPTGALFHDIHRTPLGYMPGIVINANEILTVLDGDFIAKMKPVYYNWILFLLALVFTFLFSRFHFVTKFILWIFSGAAIAALSYIFFVKHNLIFEPLPALVILTVTYLILLFYDAIKNLLEKAALEHQVITDNLTGLYSHRYLELRLEVEYRKHRELKKELCFIMVDIDFFKKVNDTYGHEHGNLVLIAVAKALKNGVRGYDVAARYGGEEFSLILSDCEEKNALQTMERIRKSIEALKFPTAQGEMSVTISMGICSIKNPAVKSHQDLKRLADEALYQAKKSGRNRICIYQSPSPA